MVWKSCCPSRETPALMAYAWLSFSSFSIRALLASWGETEIGLKLGGGGGEGGRAQTRGHSVILHTACTPHHPQRVAVHPPAFPLPFPSYHCILAPSHLPFVRAMLDNLGKPSPKQQHQGSHGGGMSNSIPEQLLQSKKGNNNNK